MKTLTQLKQAMKAPMYRELTGRELLIYKTGFKNGKEDILKAIQNLEFILERDYND